jgi:hypothetical protein
VRIGHRGLPGRHQRVVGDDLAGGCLHHQQPAAAGAQLDGVADQAGGDRVAGRAEPHARQPVDLAGGHRAQAQPQRRQRPQQLTLGGQPLQWDGGDLRVRLSIDRNAPRLRRGGSGGQAGEWRLRHQQVPLGVTDQMLHDPLRLRVPALAEVRPEPVVSGQPHVVRRRDDHVGDHAALQTCHPVGQHHLRHPAQLLQALREQREGRLRPLIGGEPHEPVAAPGQHRAEQVQPALAAPVDDQHLPGRPHRGPAAAVMAGPPGALLRRDQPPEVPRRTRIARGPGRRQQPLGRDPTPGLVHPSGHQLSHRVEVALPPPALRTLTTRTMPLDDPPDRLWCGATHLGGPTVAAHLAVGGDDVHPFPRRLQWSPLGGAVTGWHRHHHRPGAHAPNRHERGAGTPTWPAGTCTWPPAETFSWPRTGNYLNFQPAAPGAMPVASC